MSGTQALNSEASTTGKVAWKRIDREALDVRSSFDSRRRVDAYFVSYTVEGWPANDEWICRFEVERGAKFEPRNFESQAAARAAGGAK